MKIVASTGLNSPIPEADIMIVKCAEEEVINIYSEEFIQSTITS
jgi:hypothetical protein